MIYTRWTQPLCRRCSPYTSSSSSSNTSAMGMLRPRRESRWTRKRQVSGLLIRCVHAVPSPHIRDADCLHTGVCRSPLRAAIVTTYLGSDDGSNLVVAALIRQVINNSCGTLAALNAVMNIPPQASSHPGESIALGVCLRLCPAADTSQYPL